MNKVNPQSYIDADIRIDPVTRQVILGPYKPEPITSPYYLVSARVLLDEFLAAMGLEDVVLSTPQMDLYLECLNWLSKGMR